MSKLVVFLISAGNFRQGFPVILQIDEEGKRPRHFRGKFPAAPDIPQLYQNWQDTYYRLGDIRRIIRVPDAQETNRSSVKECQQTAQILETCVKEWFRQMSFRDLLDHVLEKVDRNNSVRVVFDFHTGDIEQDEQLRKLPWHLWDLFKRLPKAEFALSAEYPSSFETFRRPVRILAIFGNSEGLNVQPDRKSLEDLGEQGANVTWLPPCDEQNELTKRELINELWNKSWDILFFAGHSSSQVGGNSGHFQISLTESISPEELRNTLERAVRNGLKLAIFNSCDGLGLAQSLKRVGVPHMIVMREPVPDEVAREFLQYFLKEFSNGKPFCLALREARGWLKDVMEDRYPCASWLPVICQNPAEPELIWPQPTLWEKVVWAVKKILEKAVSIRLRRWKALVLLGWTIVTAIILAVFYKPLIESIVSPPVAFSWGEETLMPSETNSDKQNCTQAIISKDSGVKAFNAKNFPTAIDHFNNFLKDCSFDPEARIYLNNARAEREGNPLKIAVSVPISSKESLYFSQDILRGVAQAQEEINEEVEKGVTDKRLIEVGIADENINATTIEKVAHFFVKNRDILGVIGHFSSDTTQIAGQIYDGRLVVVSPASTAVRGDDPQKDQVNFSSYVFRTATNDAIAAEKLVDYMRDQLNYKQAAIVYESKNSYSRSLRKEFTDRLAARQGEVVSECNLSNPAFSASADKCVKQAITKNAQVLMLAPSKEISDKAKDIVWNNSRSQRPLKLLGGDAIYGAATLQNAGPAVEGMVIAVPWHRNTANPSEFEKRAKTLWQGEINWYTAMAYDATQAIVKGLKLLGEHPTPKELRNVLLSKGFSANGVLGEGTVKFEPSGDRKLINGLGVLIQVKNVAGKYDFVLH